MSATGHYKHHAQLNRELARHLTDSDIKAHLVAMAEIYDRLAERAECAADEAPPQLDRSSAR
jgi:hypothetical protein